MGYSNPAKPYERRCAQCNALFRTDAPGASWKNRKGSVRYVHPGCQAPGKDWKEIKA